jgi:ketopantoate reductase
MVSGTGALIGYDSGRTPIDAIARPIALQMAAEAVAVARAAGHPVEPIVAISLDRYMDAALGGDEGATVNAEPKEIGRIVARTGGQASPLQDPLKGRRTEIIQLSGLVAGPGAELGVLTPASDALVGEFERLGVGFTPEPAILDSLVRALAGRTAAEASVSRQEARS